MKKICFLSDGEWPAGSAASVSAINDAFTRMVDLAIALEKLGADGAYFRVHHFTHRISAPLPLLTYIGSKTRRIELGTAVLDMRYENPFLLAENSSTADFLLDGRLQLGIGRGTVEQAINGWRYFHKDRPRDLNEREFAQKQAIDFISFLEGKSFAEPNRYSLFPNLDNVLRLEPCSKDLRKRLWWGSGSQNSAVWAANMGLNIQLSNQKIDEGGGPFHIQQNQQIKIFKNSWNKKMYDRTPRIAVLRTIYPITDSRDRAFFCKSSKDEYYFQSSGNQRLLVGPVYCGGLTEISDLIRNDIAVSNADTILVSLPTRLGNEICEHIAEVIINDLSPILGWR